MQIPTDNFIEAIKAAFSITGACIVTGFVYFLNYAVTKYIEQYDKLKNDE